MTQHHHVLGDRSYAKKKKRNQLIDLGDTILHIDKCLWNIGVISKEEGQHLQNNLRSCFVDIAANNKDMAALQNTGPSRQLKKVLRDFAEHHQGVITQHMGLGS